MAEICIIIPVYNAEPYIHRCLNSILRQTFQDYQVLLVNDGSTDESLEICSEYSKRDSRFITIDKKNGGAASARNAGLDWYYANSESPWFCFIDIDDFVHERYLEVLLDAERQNGTAISMCSYVETHENELTGDLPAYDSVRIETERIWCERQINCTSPWAKLFRKDSFLGIHYPEGIIHEDEFTLYKVLFQQKEIAFADVPLYGYFQTEQSVMRGEWTPRHMTEPKGILCQMQFFRENGYLKAERYAARMYLQSLYRNLIGAREAGSELQTCIRQLRRDLRRGLLRYGRLAGVRMEEENWLYYAAFPMATSPYRLWKKLFGK